MDKEKKHVFPAGCVDWIQLESIGVFKDDLEQSGQLERLLDGECTGTVPLNLMLRGLSLELDATLQLTMVDETVVVEIKGISNDPASGLRTAVR